ncbi:unnamed protein product [Merluccius merluccius]
MGRWQEDVLSTRASGGLNIVDEWEERQMDRVPYDSGSDPLDAARSSLRMSVVSRTSVARPAIKMALAQLGLDAPPVGVAGQSAFFRQAAPPTTCAVPPSAPFVGELQSRRALRTLPVVPGQLFGVAAQQALERTLQVTQARQQFTSLRQAPPRSQRLAVSTTMVPPIPRPLTPAGAPLPEGFRQLTSS